MKLHAQFVSSRAVGGAYVAHLMEDAIEMAKAAISTIDAKYRHLHSTGMRIEVTEDQVAWALGGGGGDPFNRCPIHLHPSVEICPSDVSRGTGGWDFTSMTGL